MSEPLISVLVPVYNVEKTLARLVESIFNQSFKEFEIIFVNDGSTDNSGALCDEYASRYDNIKVIHKENEGLGPTRNVGIREASGKYIYHCDSDDWIKEDLLEKAYRRLEETNADMVVFGYEIFTENNGEIVSYKKILPGEKLLTDSLEIRKEFTKHYFDSFVMMSACNRMYRRSFIVDNDLYFPPLRRCQDMAYSFLLFNKIEKLALINEAYYCYIIEPGVYKGRSYNEMIEIYQTIFSMASDAFSGWGLYDAETKEKLNDYVCEQIANYSSYAFAVKYRDQRKTNILALKKNKAIREMFLKYKNVKKSRFMQMFCLGIRLRSTFILKFVSDKVQRRGRR